MRNVRDQRSLGQGPELLETVEDVSDQEGTVFGRRHQRRGAIGRSWRLELLPFREADITTIHKLESLSQL